MLAIRVAKNPFRVNSKSFYKIPDHAFIKGHLSLGLVQTTSHGAHMILMCAGVLASAQLV